MFWSGGSDGCAYFRCKLPARELANRGHDTHVAWVWNDQYTGKGDGWLKPDVLVGQRVTNPGPSSTWQKACKDPDIFTVFELDDDLFNIDPSNSIAYEFFSQPHNQERLIKNIKMADRVVVSTGPLADLARKWNSDVVVVPNTVPKDLLLWRPMHRSDVGWAGSGTHSMDWDYNASQIKRWFVRNPDVSLHMIGQDYGASWGLKNYRCSGWKDAQAALWSAFDFRVGLAPLRPHIFNRSKSHVKALEYAALGIPVIASAVEPYANFVRHGVSGFLVRRDHDWSKYLSMLVNDPEMATAMGQAARRVAAEYTIEGMGGAWARAYGIPEHATLGV